MEISRYAKNTTAIFQPLDISCSSRTASVLAARTAHKPVEDELILSGSYPKAEVQMEENEEIKRLTAQLKMDTSFVNDKSRHFISNPTGRALAKAIILSDESLQEDIAKMMWKDIAEANARKAGKPFSKPLDLPSSYKEYDIKAMLSGRSEADQTQIFFEYSCILTKKAKTEGLNDTERLLGAEFERLELYSQGTFDDKMKPVQKNIEEGFAGLGLEFDKSKSYAFHLDTSTFKFSVSGGTDRENALIAQILNTSNYMMDNLSTTLTALSFHRRDDGKYNPWMLDKVPCPEDNIPRHGVASASPSYTAKMQQLQSAYQWHHMDQSLKNRYGFGVEELQCQGGKVVGKTEEVSKIIDADRANFEKFMGDAYTRLVTKYTGTPVFTEPMFKFQDGKFSASFNI